MSDTNVQVAANTQGSGDAQPAAAPAAAGVATNIATPAATDTAATSQQAPEGQTAQADQPAAGSDGDKGAQTDKPAQGDKPTGAPESYEFKAPDGVTLSDSVVAEFSAVAKELDLPQDAAQKVIDKLAPAIAKQNAEAISQAVESAATAWVQATQSDKEIGGEKLNENLAVAKKALDRFGTPELRKLLGAYDPKNNPNGTGLGNHPEIIRAFLKAGRAISEDKFVPGGRQPTKGERDLAKSLYPNQPA